MGIERIIPVKLTAHDVEHFLQIAKAQNTSVADLLGSILKTVANDDREAE